MVLQFHILTPNSYLLTSSFLYQNETHVERENPRATTAAKEPPADDDEAQLYRELGEQLRELLAEERDLIANAANFSALLYHGLPEVNWAGFYFLKNGVLVLGPFQGKLACTRIALGKGVCGTAAASRKTALVENVHECPGHIACDAASNSEIVLPILQDGRVVAVLDLDSPRLSRFDDEDRAGLESLVRSFIELTEFAAA